MASREQFESIADACLAAHAEIEKHGTSEMQHLIRILLFQIGQQLARRQSGDHEVIQGPWVRRSE